MYKSDNYYIGDTEVLTIQSDNGPRIDVIPSKGGVLHQIFLGQDSIPILNQFTDSADIDKNSAYKQTVLFPFPNRLKDGTYTYNDTNYAFPINEPERNNALHGFVYDQEFVVTELDLTDDKGSVELSYLYHGQNDAYPFPFTLRVKYSIGKDGFTMRSSVENTGYDKLPYGFGWHPYFKTDSVARIKSSVANLQLVNDRMLPTGEESMHNFGDDLRDVSEKFDSAFRVAENESFLIGLGDFAGNMIEIKADESFRFFQIYNPDPQIIAVEPVNCNINALNTGDELIELDKGETNVHRIEISLGKG